MPRQSFEKKLRQLEDEILKMGSLVEEAIARSVDALARQDQGLANQVEEGDAQIDRLERQIDDRCMELIATQQPMAKDLRRLGAALRIIIDLERMGDHATDIARVVKRIGGEPLVKPLIDIPRMAELTQKMVKIALDAYIKQDTALAGGLADMDDQIDHLNNQVMNELILIMIEDPRKITQSTHLLFVSSFLERIADHATNIGELVVFQATGERPNLNP